MTPAERALERLATWPDLTAGPAACGTGRALSTPHSEIVHFHSDREVDLHLTGRAIQRFARDLRASTAIRLLPGSRWVTVHLDCDTDIDLLLSLVSMALQAHETHQTHQTHETQESHETPAFPQPALSADCNLRRVMRIPRDAPLA